jgi:hypothetical protein
MRASKYLEAVISACNSRTEFRDKQHEVSLANLADPGKIPREIISELFEAS